SERRNMVFSATHIVCGRGKAVVTATGMNTEFRKIAEMVQTDEEEETPLQRKLGRFASKIAKVVVAVCVLIFALEAFGVITKMHFEAEGFIRAFTSSISLAISAVPEGLPAIVTIALALGARELAKRNAIVRRLSAAESLSAVAVICSDKTGTITKGEMTVRQIYVDGKLVEVTGIGYEPSGEFHISEDSVKSEGSLELVLRIGALCNNTRLRKNEQNNNWEIFGDPTEGALIVAAAKAGLRKEALENSYPRISEIPFTSERKRMTTIHKTPEGEIHAYMKGAPEVVLERCTHIFEEGKERRLTEERKKEILGVNEQLAGNALRVLAMAYRRLPETITKYDAEAIEKGMVFVGLQGMIDPPREEVIEANKKCQKAGIKAVMITGDHKLTAIAVAKEVGIYKEGDMVLTGAEMDQLSSEEFEEIVEKVTVYARVSPEHKLKIVNALKEKGHVVAMAGDGVNDAPAVKAADVGVAMGISGTDVTREASDLVLTDDNFATIVKAVEQGRVIYDNIKKYVRFLISCNFDELLVMSTFAILGGVFSPELFPHPLLPAMILWINLVTDGAPAVALATDPPDVDVMDRPPRKPGEGIFHGMGAFIIASFILQTTGTLLVFCLEYYVWPSHPWISPDGTINAAARELTYRKAATKAFVQAALFELFVVWNCRSERRSVWRMGRKAFENKFFVIADLASIALTIGITYIPTTQKLFRLTSLSLTDLAYVIGVASWGLLIFPEIFIGEKVWKWE
ncbi:MAG: cation-transporting P-type ATPase, partial [Candidatus Bathyarchaeia archaeon]